MNLTLLPPPETTTTTVAKTEILANKQHPASLQGFPISANDTPPATHSVLQALLCPILS